MVRKKIMGKWEIKSVNIEEKAEFRKIFVNKILKQLVSSFAKWGITNSQCCSQTILRVFVKSQA